jgi:predicted chitinase
MGKTARLAAGATVLAIGAAGLTACGPNVGTVEVGWYRQSDASFHERMPGGSSVPFVYGPRGATDVYPVAGDWDGDGRAQVGWYRQSDGSFHLRNADGSSTPFAYGPAGASGVYPVAGDWDGDGKAQVGWYRQSDASFHLRNANGSSTPFGFGPDGATDVYPIAGDWDGDGRAQVGWYRQRDGSFHLRQPDGSSLPFAFGPANATGIYPVAGDWDGDGEAQVGWYRQSDGSFHLRRTDGSSLPIGYGPVADARVFPIAGNWDGDVTKPAPPPVSITDIENIYGPLGSSRQTVIGGLPSLNAAMRTGRITTPARKAAFLATLRNESGFRYNAVQSGSSTYRGRGFIQLTADFNYEAAGSYLGYDLLSDPGAAATLALSAPVARWYWTVARNINAAADRLDMAAVNVAIGYAPSAAEDAERCDDFKAALRHFNGGTLPAGINCVRGATAASMPNPAYEYPASQPKGQGVGH